MIRYNIFYRQHVIWKTSQFQMVEPLDMLKELPIEAVLHICDNFHMDKPAMMLPDDTNPIRHLNQNYQFMYTQAVPVLATKDDPTKVISVDNKGIFLPQCNINSLLQGYKRIHQRELRLVQSVDALPFRSNINNLVYYNPLYRARVTGMMRKVKLTTWVMAQMLNVCMRAPERQHFIHIPLKPIRFERQHFMRAFKEMSRSTLVYQEIPQYIFLAHLYAFLYNQQGTPAQESFMGQLTDYWQDHYDTDICAAMEGFGMDQPFKASLFEMLDEKYWNNMNLLFTAGGQYICYNLGTLKAMVDKNQSIILRVINHVNTLADFALKDIVAPTVVEPVPETMQMEEELPEQELKDDVPENEVLTPGREFGAKVETPVADDTAPTADEVAPETVPEDLVLAPDTGTGVNAPEFVAPMSDDQAQKDAELDIVETDNEALKSVNETPDISPEQRKRAMSLSTAYKHVTLGGEPIGQILVTNTSTKLESEPIPLKSEVPGVKINTNSSITALDREYMSKTFKRDLAGIFTSFNRHGMFLVDVQESRVTDTMNDLHTYVVKYEDTRHRTHTIKMTIPHFDEEGRCRVNGTLKAMSKQRVALPICKVPPSRVALNSGYNKALLERNKTQAHSIGPWFDKYISRINHKVVSEPGSNEYPRTVMSGDYVLLGQQYNFINIEDIGLKLFFQYGRRYENVPVDYRNNLLDYETRHGILMGYKSDTSEGYFIAPDGVLTTINLISGEVAYIGTLIDKIADDTGEAPSTRLTEWVDLQLLDKSLPVVFALAYRFGLTNMLNYCGADYRLEDANSRLFIKPSDAVIRFKDKRLVLGRTPATPFLIFAGLAYFDLSDIFYEEMDEKNVYYEMLQAKGYSTNNIKGIDWFFNEFIDPMTRNILREMKMPTNCRDLLIKAVSMLTTAEHYPASSRRNFRYRGVEQVTSIIYNEMAKSFAAYHSKSIGAKRNWSISEYAIKQRILTEQLMETVDILNPIDDIKQQTKFSHAGSGGRKSDTFTVIDRQFADDAMGVISEATTDNGKVGLNAIAPLDPLIVNTRGMCIGADEDVHALDPANILSINSLVMPCVTNDD